MARLTRLVVVLCASSVFASLFVPSSGITLSTQDADNMAIVVRTSAVQYDYRNYSMIRDSLIGIVGQHSDIAELVDIGDSWEKTQGIADRDILAVKISDNVGTEEGEPEVLVMALHHAREWSTSELALMLADNLTDSYGNDSRTSWLVDNREIWIVPVVNPDGLDYALAHDQWWRKNRHQNADGSYGTDLNRNYDGSQNGDPLGEWGGAGSSYVTSDETYHGSYAFSEPETQSVRDLVLEHNFSIAVDLHSYGRLVMWPWGYTNETTSDDADLQRIGRDLASLNGYSAEQSIELYPTTGDSLDWLYGAEGVYAFCFEVGYEFHPMKSDDVSGIINNNMPALKLAIEEAGDRENRSFAIHHTPTSQRSFDTAGFELTADVFAARGVDSSSVKLHYRIDGQSWNEVPMSVSAGNDTYSAIVPATTVGSRVDYYIAANDLGGVQRMSPGYAPYELHSFTVAPMEGGPIVSFEPPSAIEGSTGAVLTANITNVSGAFEPMLLFENLTKGLSYELPMVLAGDNYSAQVVPGYPLGEYSIWLALFSNSTLTWSSDRLTLDVFDGLAPAIGEHTVNQSAFGLVEITVNCSDLYGVSSVMLNYDLDGIPGSSSMYLLTGTASNGTWYLQLEVADAVSLEYNFTANDSRQGSDDPQTGGAYQFSLMQQVIELPLIVAVVGVIVVVVALASFPRRR